MAWSCVSFCVSVFDLTSLNMGSRWVSSVLIVHNYVSRCNGNDIEIEHELLYSVIGDFFMISRLLKDVVFQINNKKNTTIYSM
jgi:hypothetical protein